MAKKPADPKLKTKKNAKTVRAAAKAPKIDAKKASGKEKAKPVPAAVAAKKATAAKSAVVKAKVAPVKAAPGKKPPAKKVPGSKRSSGQARSLEGAGGNLGVLCLDPITGRLAIRFEGRSDPVVLETSDGALAEGLTQLALVIDLTESAPSTRDACAQAIVEQLRGFLDRHAAATIFGNCSTCC